MQSLPVSTEAPRSAPMTSSSSTFRSNAAHVRRSDLTLSIVHPSDAGTLSAEFISCIELSEQPSWGNYPVLPPQAGHYSDQLGGVQGINGIDSVQRQQIPGSLTDPTETNDGNEWSMYLDLDDITIPDIVDYRMAGSSHVSVPSNSETLHNMVQQSVAVPSNSELLYPTVSANEQTHSPKRPRVRMRWTMEMHNLFVDAVKQLGGSENAKPKAILDIMNVEGLTRDQVKSHLQKYKSALSRHNSPEGSLVGTITPSEAVQLDVQIMQLEFQKKLHEMLEKTRRDILELHTSMLGELEKRRTLSVDSTTQVPGEGTSTRIAPRMQPVMHRRLPHMIAMLEHDRAFYAAFSCSHVNNIRISSGQ